ncbi:MAG TPA: GAF domain-containing protein, partial [Chloroflexi bacterium]|nr:GAF domain-containing protein [Chloroflexota bacterium]
MNSDTQAAQAGGSGSAHLFLQAMAEVAAATSPEEIISALQKHILSDADHIGLIQVGFGAIGEPVFRSAASRDRDGLAGEDIPPEAVRQALGSSPLFIADVGELDEAEAPLRAYIEDTLRAASLALIPLTGRARIAGYLVVASRQPRRYSEEEQQALTALAQQAAVILENTLLLDTLSRQTERLSLINELAQAIKGAFDVAALGRQVVQTLSQIIPLSHLSIALLEPDGQEAQMHTFHGSPLPSPAPVTDSCLGAALREGRSLQIESVRDCGSYGEHWAAAGAPTLLIVPLTARKRHVGTLNIGLP